MGILKNGNYDNSNISSLNISTMKFDITEKVETISEEKKEEYTELIEETKKTAYDIAYKEGFKQGYSNGSNAFNEESKILYNQINTDKDNLRKFLHEQSIEYINSFEEDIVDIISSSINKIFYGAINDETIMKIYFENLISYLSNKYDKFVIYLNSNSAVVLEETTKKYNIDTVIDNKLKDYDFLIKSENQNIEYYLKDEFVKIKEIFN